MNRTLLYNTQRNVILIPRLCRRRFSKDARFEEDKKKMCAKLRQHSRTLGEHNSEVRNLLDEIIRVDHAGEVGAKYIYMGQLAVLRNHKSAPLIEHMAAQEEKHLDTFNKLLIHYRVRPTLLEPVWRGLGFALGAGSALLGVEGAMACTVAVETVIGEHYNDQLRELHEIKHLYDDPTLRATLAEFRDEELEHLEIGMENDAEMAPFYSALAGGIKTCCRTAIQIVKYV